MINIYDNNAAFIIESDNLSENANAIKYDIDRLLETCPDHKVIFNLSKTDFIDDKSIGLFVYYNAELLNIPEKLKRIIDISGYKTT